MRKINLMRVAAIALAALLEPVAAPAQDLPSYAQPVSVSTDETIHGRIASVDGAFNISVADDRGFIDNVALHQGTIINPTGLSLASGMSVTISGYNAGSVFDANEIDTPYSYSGELPVPVYYGAGYWCPGFAYGYGPSFTLAIVFGSGFQRFEHRPFYGRPWDGRHYFGAYVGSISGGPRHTLRGSPGERRSFTGAVRSEYAHAPSAFTGRSFAGRPYTATGGVGHRTFAQPYARSTGVARFAYPAAGAVRSTGSGFSRNAPGSFGVSAPHRFTQGMPSAGFSRGAAGGGFARGSAGGGFARGSAGGGFARGSAGGGFARGSAGGGFARGSAGGGFARGSAGGGFARGSAGGGFARGSAGGGIRH